MNGSGRLGGSLGTRTRSPRELAAEVGYSIKSCIFSNIFSGR